MYKKQEKKQNPQNTQDFSKEIGSEKELQEKFLEVYNKEADAIFRHCYFRISDRELANDLLQETFIRTWKYLAKGGEIKNIRAFLYRVANNLLVDEYRKKKTTSLDLIREKGFEPENHDFKDSVENKIEVQLVLKYMDTLDDKYRKVLIMRYVDDLKVKEIANILEETESTISVRIHRALKKMEEYIKETQKPRETAEQSKKKSQKRVNTVAVNPCTTHKNPKPKFIG